MKYAGISALVLIAFTAITTTAADLLAGDEGLLLTAASLALPVICLIASTLFIQTTLLVNFLLDLLLLPLRLLGLRRKRHEEEVPYEEGDEFIVPRGHAIPAIFISTGLYSNSWLLPHQLPGC